MGKLVDGKWVTSSVITSDDSGAYNRVPRSFLGTIQEEGSIFKPEVGRYHLYVSYACPWAHRTLIFRKLKELEDIISVSVVHPDMLDDGWVFNSDFPEATIDHLFSYDFLREVYQLSDSNISTTVTVPILFDKKTKQIVNNESSEIIRIFNSSFNGITGNTDDYYPEEYRNEIDEINNFIYHKINNGVYKTGFSKNQFNYEENANDLFEALNRINLRLTNNDFLVGSQMTEADIRLIPTLIRFDPVYYIHFKCSKKLIREFDNISRYLKRMISLESISETTNMDHIKRHYYFSHKELNPSGIIPL
jgi:glutathionyl-hydroquinone reductase